jgi:hypothetical protein
MKKFLYSFLTFVVVIIATTVYAQSYDFEDYDIGDTFETIGWNTSDLKAEVADDPLSSGNNVLKCTVHNYNAAPVLEFTLPEGTTLADYEAFTFKGYFAQGDVGWKEIIVEAYQTMPEGQFNSDANVKIGSWNRATGGSTAWEDITVDITNTSDFTGTIYIAFGIHCAGTGDIGGTGVTTIWYADDIQLVGPQESIESNPNIIPTTFKLSQNYPNPFNPTTKIEFGLPQQSDVSLIIYDIRGRAIATLVDGTFNAGQHTVTFDASHLASGVYFYKLEAKDFVNVKKLMLMK